MTPELYWLTYVVVLTAVLWIPYILNRMREHPQGAFAAMWNPQPDLRPKAQWAERLMRAHANAVENLVIFAPLVLTAHVLGIHSSITINACIIYFFARLAHAILYAFGVPLLRTVAFFIGFCCQMTLVYSLLQLTL